MERIEWTEGRRVSAHLEQPHGERGRPVLLAHGAGGDQDSPFIADLRRGLAEAGHPVVTFNYPYSEEGRKAPDSQPTLLRCHRAALSWFEGQVGGPFVLAGKSMGGRMASYLAAEGEPCAGLVFFGYPLHPAGRPDRLRADHLASITVPMLFLAGTRDALCRLDLLSEVVAPLPSAQVVTIEGGDHSFRVAGRSRQEVMRELVAATSKWAAERLVRRSSVR